MKINKYWLFVVTTLLIIFSSNAFADYGENAPGFFQGLWDGSVWIAHLIEKIYSDQYVYQDYNNGFWYNLAFFGAVLILSWDIGAVISFFMIAWDLFVFILKLANITPTDVFRTIFWGIVILPVLGWILSFFEKKKVKTLNNNINHDHLTNATLIADEQVLNTSLEKNISITSTPVIEQNNVILENTLETSYRNNILSKKIEVESSPIENIAYPLHNDQIFKLAQSCNFSILNITDVSKITDNEGNSPIHHLAIACKNNLLLVKKLLQYDLIDKISGQYGLTPLHLLLSHYDKNTTTNIVISNTIIIEAILSHPAISETEYSNGRTPLEYLSGFCLPRAVVEKILQHPSSILINSITKKSPLFNLAHNCKTFESIELIIRHPSIDKIQSEESGETPLHLMASFHNVIQGELLLQHPSVDKVKDKNGNTPLHNIVDCCKSELVDKVLAHPSIDIVKNENGSTPLHEFWMNQDDSIIKKLIKHPSFASVKSNDGNTPLHFFSMFAFMEFHIEQAMIHPFVDIVKNNNGDTPMHLLAMTSKNEAWTTDMDKILQHVSVDKVKNNLGETPLHLFAKTSLISTVEKILNHKSINTVENDKGETPLALINSNAELLSQPEVVKLLDEYRSKV